MRFKLVKVEPVVILRAILEGGRVYNLLTFKNNGHIIRNNNVPSNIGLQVDDIGRLRIAGGGD